MRGLAIAAALATGIASQALACDDHQGECEIEAWRPQNMMGILTIEGTTTCDTGGVTIRLYDGETYLGNASGFIEGHAFSAMAFSIPPPTDLQLKYSIDTEF